jgi:ParB family transcriptional regulator, chromosome partitioning protein
LGHPDDTGRRPARPALGKGLGALLPPSREAASAAVLQVELDNLHPSRSQPRRRFADQALTELGESIRAQGVLVPLLVRKARLGYEIIAGERRWRAARLAGVAKVPVVVVDADDSKAYLLALIENLQREDLSPLEEAEGFRRLVEDLGQTQEEVARSVGKDRSTVANALRILKLPVAVRQALDAGELTAGHARALLALPADRIEPISRQVIARGLSVRATEELVRRARTAPPDPVRRRRSPTTDAARAVASQLSQSLHTRVEVRETGTGRGLIEITYHTLDELDRLLNVMLK